MGEDYFRIPTPSELYGRMDRLPKPDPEDFGGRCSDPNCDLCNGYGQQQQSDDFRRKMEEEMFRQFRAAPMPRPAPKIECVNSDCIAEKKRLKESVKRWEDEAARQNREGGVARDLIARIAKVVDLDLSEDMQGDTIWAKENMERVLPVIDDLMERVEMAEYERDEYDKEADALAGAYENAVQAIDYWKGLAQPKGVAA